MIGSNSIDSDMLLQLVESICAALNYMRRRGIVHGDVKPSNIGFDSEFSAKLLDFGLAGAASNAVSTDSDEKPRGGTYAYMSPEQLLGGQADQRADLWSLAVTLFECMSGYNPLQSDTIQTTAENVFNAENLISHGPLPRFFKIALAADIRNRPQSAAELLNLFRDKIESNGDHLRLAS